MYCTLSIISITLLSKITFQLQSNVLLGEQIKDPHGRIVANNEFKNQFFTTTQPQLSGNYTVTITNLGNQLVTVNTLFGQVPFVNEKNQIQLGQAISIIGGGIAIVFGRSFQILMSLYRDAPKILEAFNCL